MKGAGEIKNVAGDPRFFLNGWLIWKYHGGLKNQRGHPEGTSTGSVPEGSVFNGS